jgi:hypothetical protein
MAVSCLVGMAMARKFAALWVRLISSLIAFILGLVAYFTIGFAVSYVLSRYGLLLYQGAFPDDAGTVFARAIGEGVWRAISTAALGVYLGVWRAPKIFKWHTNSASSGF